MKWLLCPMVPSPQEMMNIATYYKCNHICHRCRVTKTNYMKAPSTVAANFQHSPETFLSESIKPGPSPFGFISTICVYLFYFGLILEAIYFFLHMFDSTVRSIDQPSNVHPRYAEVLHNACVQPWVWLVDSWISFQIATWAPISWYLAWIQWKWSLGWCLFWFQSLDPKTQNDVSCSWLQHIFVDRMLSKNCRYM